MATKKSAPAKKSTPVKKQVKAAKPAPKAAAKKPAVKTAAKKAAPKKAAPSKAKITATKAVTKTVSKSAKSAKVISAPKKISHKANVKVPAKTAKKTDKKPAVKTVSTHKPAIKHAPKKEHTTKPPVVPRLTTKSAVKYQPDFTKSILDIHKNDEVKSVIRYSDSDLKEFKEIILRKLDAAKKELAYLQGLITRRDEGGDVDEGRYMTMEDGSVSMEREQLSQLASRQITFIDHLEKALMRVENKTYGICRVTGNLIDKARLRAVPHATLSIEAKSMMNK